MSTLKDQYLSSIQKKEDTFGFSPRLFNALYNWIYHHIMQNKLIEKWYKYSYWNESKEEQNCRLSLSDIVSEETDKIMISFDSLIKYLIDNKIDIYCFKWIWNLSYQEFLDKLNS